MNQEEMIRDVRKRLFESAGYRISGFSCKAGSDCGEEKIIGIRTPILRDLRKNLEKQKDPKCS